MALQSTAGGLHFPEIPNVTALAALANLGTTLLINAAGEKVDFIFSVPKTGTVTTLGFRTGTVTTSDTLKVGLYTIDGATGLATATAYGGMVAGTVSGLASNTYYEVVLGTNASVTVGDRIALSIEFNSWVAGNLVIAVMDATIARGFPYIIWNGAKFGYTPLCTIKYDDNTYGPDDCLPCETSAATTFSNASTPDERALKFSPPWKARMPGFWVLIDADGDCDIILYEGTTVRATYSIDKDVRGATVGRFFNCRFTTPYELAANTTYYLAVKPTTTTAVGLYEFTVAAANMMACFSGGTSITFSSRVDAGAWTGDDALRRPWMGLIIDQFDDGAAAGGLAANPLRGFIG